MSSRGINALKTRFNVKGRQSLPEYRLIHKHWILRMRQSRRRHWGISCKKTARELTNYMEGLSDASLNVEIEKHIELCRDCRVLLETTQKMLQLVGDEDAFLKAFEKQTKTKPDMPSPSGKKHPAKKK